MQAGSVVLATGALQRPRVPDYSAEIPTGVTQLIAGDYRKPAAVAAGKVLIVGSGETGVQIAEELASAGRDVYLSGGRSWWAPRRYRGRDITAWLRLLGYFDRLVGDLPRGQRTGKPNPQLTGADGGHDINPHLLRRSGVTLLGRLKGIEGGRAFFVDDLAANVAWGDAQARDLLASIDRLAADQELQAAVEDWPADLADSSTRSPASIWSAPAELDLVADGVSTVIWATGYRPDFGWVDLPFLDADGHPVQRRGVTQVPGLYVLGLDWLHTARSGLFAGVGDDASYVASAIVATGA